MKVDVLTANDAARILAVPRQRITQLVAEGKLRASLRLSPRVHLYEPADVEHLRAERLAHFLRKADALRSTT
jgi:predicted rRNA methylase YqxC with S4 and FtsJ domains